MKHMPEKMLRISQLLIERSGSLKDNSQDAFMVTFIEDGQRKHGVFEKITKIHPGLLAKMSVAAALFKRIFQGNRTTEMRVVINDNNVLVGTVSLPIDGFEPFNHAEDAVPHSTYQRKRVIPNTQTLIDENIIELLIGRWFLSDGDCQPHHLSLVGDINYNSFWSWFTIHMTNTRIIGTPIKYVNLTTKDFENFPCIEDAKPNHWPAYAYPGLTTFLNEVPITLKSPLKMMLPNTYAEPEQFANLAKSSPAHEQIFAACLKILLTYQPTMIRHHLLKLFGDMPFDYTSLDPEVRILYERDFPQLCNSETNGRPFVDFIMSLYQQQYDSLYRVVVFYMGCDSNRYGLPLPATSQILSQKPSYYQSIKLWIIKQNKTLFANHARELQFNEDELEKRLHHIWRHAFAPTIKELLFSVYELTNKVLQMTFNAKLKKISSKSHTDPSLTNISDYFGHFPEIAMDEIPVDPKGNLRRGLLLLVEFYNKFNKICETYYHKELTNLQFTDNLNFCQQLNELHKTYPFQIRKHLAFINEAVTKFNNMVAELFDLKSQVNFFNHSETAAEYFSQQLLTQVTKLTIEKEITEFAFSTIDIDLAIDEQLLNRFIELLEKQNSPIADLTCGLLLEGRIKTSAEILANCKAYDNYMEKRTHDAISFYIKAGRDLKIKPIVEFLLWDMKMTIQWISIQKRLGQYDLNPEGTGFCDNKKSCGVVLPLIKGLGLFKVDKYVRSDIENIGLVCI